MENPLNKVTQQKSAILRNIPLIINRLADLSKDDPIYEENVVRVGKYLISVASSTEFTSDNEFWGEFVNAIAQLDDNFLANVLLSLNNESRLTEDIKNIYIQIYPRVKTNGSDYNFMMKQILGINVINSAIAIPEKYTVPDDINLSFDRDSLLPALQLVGLSSNGQFPKVNQGQASFLTEGRSGYIESGGFEAIENEISRTINAILIFLLSLLKDNNLLMLQMSMLTQMGKEQLVSFLNKFKDSFTDRLHPDYVGKNVIVVDEDATQYKLFLNKLANMINHDDDVESMLFGIVNVLKKSDKQYFDAFSEMAARITKSPEYRRKITAILP